MARDAALDGWQPAMRIPGHTRANLKAAWAFTVLWNLVSAPVLVYIPPELERNPLAAIRFLFPIAGAGLFIWAFIATLRWRRFGEPWLEPTSGVARPGSRWTGVVHAGLPSPGGGVGYTVMLRLSCLQRTISRTSDDSSVHERIVWREEAAVPSDQITFSPGTASIPARFDIPDDARETTAVGKGEGVLWVLTAEAELPGVNLKEDFELRVDNAAGATPTPVSPRRDAQRPGPAPVTVEELARAGIRVEPAPDGMAYTFGAMRNVSFAVGLTAFTVIWTGALWVQWKVGFPWILPILVITGLVELLLVVVVVDLWLGSTTTTVGSGEVRRRHTLLGLGSTRAIAASDIASVDLHISMQTEGRYGTPYYDVRAVLKNGRKVSLGSGVRSKPQAEWLAGQMRSAIGLRA
jgi:hypothetical protein